MVAVTFHHSGNVNPPVAFEMGSVIACRPFVESLVYDKQSKRVAHVKHLCGWRVVTASYGVDTKLFKNRITAHLHLVGYSRAEDACVLMHTHALQLYVFAIEPEAFLRLKLYGAHSELASVLVNRLAINLNLCLNSVTERVGDVPKVRGS